MAEEADLIIDNATANELFGDGDDEEDNEGIESWCDEDDD